MITSARCLRSTQWPETRIGSTCGALSVILLPFGFLCCCRVLSMWILQLSHCLLIWGRCQGWLTLSSSCTRCYSVSCCLTLVHAHLHSFLRTCSFSLVRVCFHWHALMCLFSLVRVRSYLYRSIYSCTCMLVLFSVVCARSNCSQLYALIFSDMYLFSVGHSFFALVFSWMPSFSVYAFILSGTHSFSVGCTRSWLYTLVLACMHLFSPVCTRPRPHTHTP